MSSFFNLTLDTLPPQNVTLSVNDNALYTVDTSVMAVIATSDTDTTGYQMKIWGSVQNAETENSAPWQTLSDSVNVMLIQGDGVKTVNLRVRDNVWNESAVVSRTIILDMTDPIVTITSGPDLTVISKIIGRDSTEFSFRVNKAFAEYRVRVVPNISSLHTAGAAIGIIGGSVNMNGIGNFAENSEINCTIKGSDLAAAAGTDGTHVIKIFARDLSGRWSVV